jgi:signal recognition particle subunit SRP19
MRKQNKFFLWPPYFDTNKTRHEGRRVPKKFAVPAPKLDELLRAARRLGLQPTVVTDAAHPSSPWQRSGLLVVPKKESKGETVTKIAKELVKLRK